MLAIKSSSKSSCLPLSSTFTEVTSTLYRATYRGGEYKCEFDPRRRHFTLETRHLDRMKGVKKGKVRTQVRTPLPMSPLFHEVFSTCSWFLRRHFREPEPPLPPSATPRRVRQNARHCSEDNQPASASNISDAKLASPPADARLAMPGSISATACALAYPTNVRDAHAPICHCGGIIYKCASTLPILDGCGRNIVKLSKRLRT